MPEPISTPVRQRSSSVFRHPAGIRHRLLRGRQAEDDEIVDAALFLGIDPLIGIERAVAAVAARHVARDACAGKIVRLEFGDRPRAGLARRAAATMSPRRRRPAA